MRTLTAAELADLHAARTRKGPGYAPTLAECLDAAREGRLYDIDTLSVGLDGLTIADDAESAIRGWAGAMFDDHDDCDGDWHDALARWTAERVTLAE